MLSLEMKRMMAGVPILLLISNTMNNELLINLTSNKIMQWTLFPGIWLNQNAQLTAIPQMEGFSLSATVPTSILTQCCQLLLGFSDRYCNQAVSSLGFLFSPSACFKLLELVPSEDF